MMILGHIRVCLADNLAEIVLSFAFGPKKLKSFNCCTLEIGKKQAKKMLSFKSVTEQLQHF
jgi:hypothetical protein